MSSTKEDLYSNNLSSECDKDHNLQNIDIHIENQVRMEFKRKCRYCSITFPSLFHYYKHFNKCRSVNETFCKRCRYCRFQFYCISSYSRHLFLCLKVKRELHRLKKCNTEQIPEIRNQDSSSHVEELDILSDEWKYCPKCDSSFRIPLHYQMHLKRKGWCRRKPYICGDCGKTFRNVHHLISHENRKTPCKYSIQTAMSVQMSEKVYESKKKRLNEKLLINKIWKDEEVIEHNNVLSDISSEINDLMSKDYNISKRVINLKTSQYDSQHRKEFCCKRCGMTFKTRQFYFRHLIRATPCSVKVNNKSFQKCNDNLHTTLKEKPDISFVKSPEKSEHELSYECRICHKKFQFPYEIKDHLSSNPECTALSEKTFGHEKDLSKVKQTARKSFPSSYLEPKIDISVITKSVVNGSENPAMNLPKRLNIDKYEEVEENALWAYDGDNSADLTCEICHKKCVSLNSLNKHMKKHPSRVRVKYALKCPVCLQVFYSQFLLLCHQKKSKHWGKATKSRTTECNCPFCDKKFLYVRSRNTHVRNHIRERPNEVEAFLQQTTCNICFQPFASQAIKLQHLKISHLNKWNSNTEVLEVHSNQIEEPPENIGELDLENSLNIYSPETNSKKKKREKKTVIITADITALLRKYPNTCPVCKKKYCSTFVRNRHFKTHTMDKTFSCKWCTEKFFRSDRLTHHMQRVHNDLLIFECQGCGLRFPTKMHVIQHISKAHADQVRDSLVIERDLDSVLPTINRDLPEQSEAFNTSLKYEQSKEFSFSKMNKSSRKRKFCELCNTGFTKTAHLLRHHLSKMHKDNLFLQRVRNSDFLPVPSIPQKSSASRVPPSPSVPTPSKANQSKQKSFSCSVCRESFVNVSSFVPHRLGHFNFKSMDPSEINDINPYHCEICSVKLDHHQRVQVHLLWHLQSNFPIESINHKSYPTKDLSHSRPDEEELMKFEDKPSIQVAKKSSGNLTKVKKLTNTKKPLFFCDACHMGFTTKHHHSAHVRRYCQVRRAQIHSTKENSKPVITKNLRAVLPKSILQCRYCFLELFSVSDLKWHEKSCRKVQDSERANEKKNFHNFYSCNYCKYVFFNIEAFNQHKSVFCPNKLIEEFPIKLSCLDLKIIDKLKENKITSFAACLQCCDVFTSINSLTEHNNICNSIHDEASFITKRYSSLSCVKEEHEDPLKRNELVTESDNDAERQINEDDSSTAIGIEEYYDIMSVKDHVNSPLVDDSATERVNRTDEVDATTLISPTKCEISSKQDFSDGHEKKNVDKSKSENLEEQTEEFSLTELSSLAKLRDNFSQLLYLLVADPELMQQLGWGQRLIDSVLEDVLLHMGQHPVKNSSRIEIDCLRANILLLLQLCIKDQVMDKASEGKEIDDIVSEVLQMCLAGMETQDSSVD